MFAEETFVPKEAYWDYYDPGKRAFIFLKCKIHQKYATPPLLQIEETEKFHSGIATASYETPDLQLADYNGRWMTRSDDPDCYPHKPFDFEKKNCSICDLVCDVRDDERYLNEDGSCPYPDSVSEPVYWLVADQKVISCKDYLSPTMLLDLDAVNRKRRRKTKAFLWGYLKEKKWLDLQITSGRRMIDVWEKHYQPLRFYLPSVETLWLYVKNVPRKQRSKQFVSHIVSNVEKYCVNLDELLLNEWEQKMWGKIERLTDEKNG